MRARGEGFHRGDHRGHGGKKRSNLNLKFQILNSASALRPLACSAADIPGVAIPMSQAIEADGVYTECRGLADRAKAAARAMAIARGSAKDGWLRRSARALVE